MASNVSRGMYNMIDAPIDRRYWDGGSGWIGWRQAGRYVFCCFVMYVVVKIMFLHVLVTRVGARRRDTFRHVALQRIDHEKDSMNLNPDGLKHLLVTPRHKGR